MARRKATSKGSGDAAPVFDQIVTMTDQFCREKLNEEYAVLCRHLAEKLARKRPSPLLSGKPETWACGIIRTIGWVNFLDDSSNKPHMKLTAIDKAFGVAESTGQGKSKTIRTMLQIGSSIIIGRSRVAWTTASMIWMKEVDGIFMDIRRCTREIQEIAFQKGLIPYVPADQTSKPADE